MTIIVKSFGKATTFYVFFCFFPVPPVRLIVLLYPNTELAGRVVLAKRKTHLLFEQVGQPFLRTFLRHCSFIRGVSELFQVLRSLNLCQKYFVQGTPD